MSTPARPPDWAALYLLHRDAMHRVAARALRPSGLQDHTSDVVQEAMLSLMRRPAPSVGDWEALMVTAVKRKAIDYMRSAAVRHAGPALEDYGQEEVDDDFAEEVAESIDRQRAAAKVWDALAGLSVQERRVVWECVARERSREDVAIELGVSPSRISQIRTKALEKLRDAMREVDAVD